MIAKRDASSSIYFHSIILHTHTHNKTEKRNKSRKKTRTPRLRGNFRMSLKLIAMHFWFRRFVLTKLKRIKLHRRNELTKHAAEHQNETKIWTTTESESCFGERSKRNTSGTQIKRAIHCAPTKQWAHFLCLRWRSRLTDTQTIEVLTNKKLTSRHSSRSVRKVREKMKSVNQSDSPFASHDRQPLNDPADRPTSFFSVHLSCSLSPIDMHDRKCRSPIASNVSMMALVRHPALFRFACESVCNTFQRLRSDAKSREHNRHMTRMNICRSPFTCHPQQALLYILFQAANLYFRGCTWRTPLSATQSRCLRFTFRRIWFVSFKIDNLLPLNLHEIKQKRWWI